MKTIKKVLILSLLAAPIIFTGCQKDLQEEPIQTPEEIIDNTPIGQKDYCGDALTFDLNYWFETDPYGSITIGNDNDNLIISYEIDASNGYYIRATSIFIQNVGDVVPAYIADIWNPDGTAHILNPADFPYYDNTMNSKVHQVIIPFADLVSSGIDLDVCLEIVAGANLNEPGNPVWKQVWANPNSLKSWGWYVDFCLVQCQRDCETIYAYGEDLAMCFLDFTGSNNWGWTNGPISDGFSDTWPIYAGAGQCDISKGTHVGNLEVSYNGGTVDINYIIFPDYTLDETHVHIGDYDNRLPIKNGEFITAPGQYNYNGADFPMSGFTGDIYITAHGVVCGDYY